MSQLFISYRRKSWGFTHRLADELRKRLDADVFVDVDGVDNPDFETSILTHLRASAVVLLVVTDLTFSDRIHRDGDWVRREIREALAVGLPLVMVNVDGLLPPSGLPDDIKEIARIQGVNFYPEYFPAAVERLSDFVTKVSTVQRKGITGVANIVLEPHTLSATGTVENSPERQISGKASLDEALDLLDKQDFSKAIFLLEELRNSGFKSRFVNINEILQDAETQQQHIERRRIAKIEYDEIAVLVKRRITHDRGLAAFQIWQSEYMDLELELDIEKISQEFTNLTSEKSYLEDKGKVVAITIPSSKIMQELRSGKAYLGSRITEDSHLFEFLPKPFDWIDIPAGNATLTTKVGWAVNFIPVGTSQTFRIPSFKISKYPITNAQYRKFYEADGYNKTRWWTEIGWQERESGEWTQPRYWLDPQLNQDNCPVVGISWYEAIAYCKWLCEITSLDISLPTEWEWQRAAQKDTNWPYPWGYEFDKDRCNFNSYGTTPVTKFEGKGDSPFGVVDMSGNVWEWCLTEYETGETMLSSEGRRVLRGGSWNDKDEAILRVDYRNRVLPNHFFTHWGFRIVIRNPIFDLPR